MITRIARGIMATSLPSALDFTMLAHREEPKKESLAFFIIAVGYKIECLAKNKN
jgi:hypothetical protein